MWLCQRRPARRKFNLTDLRSETQQRSPVACATRRHFFGVCRSEPDCVAVGAVGKGVLSIGIYRFRDVAAMRAALASPVTAEVMRDVRNFTDSRLIERSIWAPMEG